MDDTGKEIAIDIDGGYGEYFLKRAIKEPDKIFIILEPRPWQLSNKPANLHIIRWKGGDDSALPLENNSVDEIDINYLFGKICPSRRQKRSRQEPANLYTKLLKDGMMVLRAGGKIRIVDSGRYINLIKEILIKLGGKVLVGPKPLEDVDRTYWSRQFYGQYGRDGESFIQPMTIEAQK